jgi:hypothetical protein
MLRHTSDLELRLSQAYDEMSAFESSTSPELFAFASPKVPFVPEGGSTYQQLAAVAKLGDLIALEKKTIAPLRTQLDPENDSPRLELRRAIGRCYQAAKYFDVGTQACSSASEKKAVSAATTALDAYIATGRILPMAVHAMGKKDFSKTTDTCKTLYDGRLPSRDDSNRMLPFILKSGKVWAEDSHWCGPWFHDASNGLQIDCDHGGAQNQAMCVDRDGLFGGITNL